MNEKPEALRLADELDAYHNAPHHKLAAIELRCQHYELRRLHAENERLREALEKSLTDEQIQQIAASIDRLMPLESAKILSARRIEAALRGEG